MKSNRKSTFFALAFLSFCYLAYYNYSSFEATIPRLISDFYYSQENSTRNYVSVPMEANSLQDNLLKASFLPDNRLEANFSSFQWCPYGFDTEFADTDLDCDSLFSDENNDTVLKQAKNWTSACSVPDTVMMALTSNCSLFDRTFPFWSKFYKSPNETEDYSLAFVIIGAQSAEQTVRLLQSLYHPRNLYCLTYDNKTSEPFKSTLRNIDSCYDNVIMPKDYVDIHWGGFSILQSVMYCLRELAKSKKIRWRYVQILSWNDFPLKTNEEMIKIMKILNGSQDAELTFGQSERLRVYHDEGRLDILKRHEHKPIPPGNLLIYKGSMAATMSSEFVNFLLDNEVARHFFNWSSTTFCPEEQFWSTMIHNMHLNPPGGFPGTCLIYYSYEQRNKPWISRYQIWNDHLCKGKTVHSSCVFGVGDLAKLSMVDEIIAHKLYLDFEPATYYCLSQLHFKKTFSPKYYSVLNTTFYENLPSVIYHNSDVKSDFLC